MNTLTIILLIYVILDIVSNIILIALMRRKGISLADLALTLKWLCEKETPTEERDDYDDYYPAKEDDVDD